MQRMVILECLLDVAYVPLLISTLLLHYDEAVGLPLPGFRFYSLRLPPTQVQRVPPARQSRPPCVSSVGGCRSPQLPTRFSPLPSPRNAFSRPFHSSLPYAALGLPPRAPSLPPPLSVKSGSPTPERSCLHRRAPNTTPRWQSIHLATDHQRNPDKTGGWKGDCVCPRPSMRRARLPGTNRGGTSIQHRMRVQPLPLHLPLDARGVRTSH